MMTVSRRLHLGAALAIGLLGWSGYAYSQVAVMPQSVPVTVLSGADVGFRMTARKGSTPVGQLVVRIDGQWQEVEFSYGIKSVTK